MTVHAFVDESRRNDTYYLAAAVVRPDRLNPLRAQLRALLFPGQRELHFYKEKPARRRLIISRVSAWQVRVDIYRAGCRSGEEKARQACLARLVDDLLDVDGRRLVLDSRQGRNAHDDLTIRHALGKCASETGVVYEHLDSAAEPLLWLADIAVWCHGAGGEWARRAAPVIGSVIRLDWP
ncbi:DUF3800 domain-containing protein [Saccharothrix australiensis]|uniref:DUF3800 domain-containing protein n=1 Tax=Saccharothrix australiensis TaxID=2072 RepID=A0A495VQL6_9PSEU|nr:DUF3800 domain-containing protein [Saccharothrix australiensis]RKT51584.1 hypothetical protein C8E97_0063 [Saccharothrix australiensis]